MKIVEMGVLGAVLIGFSLATVIIAFRMHPLAGVPVLGFGRCCYSVWGLGTIGDIGDARRPRSSDG